jgi:hypothetical protein
LKALAVTEIVVGLPSETELAPLKDAESQVPFPVVEVERPRETALLLEVEIVIEEVN